MGKKLLRWILIVAGVGMLLLAALTIGGAAYLSKHRHELVNRAARAYGLDVAFRAVDVTAWESWPLATFTLDSLVVRDTTPGASFPPLLTAGSFTARVSLAGLLDTIQLQRIDLRHASFHLESDSTGRSNAGHLFAPRSAAPSTDTTSSFVPPRFDWNGLDLDLTDVAVTYIKPARRKDLRLHVNHLQASGITTADGILHVYSTLNARIGGLAFNTEKGAYLTDAPLSGTLELQVTDDSLRVAPTELKIAGAPYRVAARFSRTKGELNHLTFANDAVDYAGARALLPADLQEKISRFDVSGRFPVQADIRSNFQRGENPEVILQFRLDGQDVRVKQYPFGRVTARGTIVNRLTPEEGGIPNDKSNVRVTLDSLGAYYLGAYLQSPHAVVAAFGKDARLVGPLRLSGPAGAVSDYLDNENFFFDRGRFELETAVDASLLSFEEIASTSNGTMRFSGVDVVYRPAGVRFPLDAISVRKQDEDVQFRIQSSPLPTGLSLELLGRINNLTPLLVDVPGGDLRADVTLLAPRIDWTDFLSFFGQDGYFPGAEEADARPEASTAATAAAMKAALLGLQRTFHPSVDARFDTVAYYDVFTLTDFSTGLHFDRDSLILERTAFNWAGSDLAFGAGLDLAGREETPFRVDVSADHLDLNRLWPALEYFGVQLPVGLDSLPEDLSIDFRHAGRIDDAAGIQPGFNTGHLEFNDGRNHLFSGLLDYTPSPAGLATRFHLGGDPRIVNQLFGAEDFFFGTGRFTIDFTVDGNPTNVEELVDKGELHLRIDSSRVTYLPGDVSLPVEAFRVDVRQGAGDYTMRLLAGADRTPVDLRGELSGFASFLDPTSGQDFRVRADLTAASLRASDFSDFTSPERDTAGTDKNFDLQLLLSTTGGVFRNFRPDVSLRIDTLWTSERTPLVRLFSGVHLEDSTRFVLEESGFTLGEGLVRFDATYDLDDKPQSAFTLHWMTDTLVLEKLIGELENMGLPVSTKFGKLAGRLTMSGSVTGEFDEEVYAPVPARTSGTLDFLLTDAELGQWATLQRIGKKAFMKKRFDVLRFAPLQAYVVLDSGLLTITQTEVQSTGIHAFVQGVVDLTAGPDLLVSIPLRNIGRGVMTDPPPPTGYALAGWKIYLVQEAGKDGEPKMKFRLGRRKFYRERGRLEELRELRAAERAAPQSRPGGEAGGKGAGARPLGKGFAYSTVTRLRRIARWSLVKVRIYTPPASPATEMGALARPGSTTPLLTCFPSVP